MTTPAKPEVGSPAWAETSEPVPVFAESLGGALIDSARISVMAAMAIISDTPIIVPNALQEGDTASVHNCLEEAMQWLDAARALTVERSGAPPTSIHVVPR